MASTGGYGVMGTPPTPIPALTCTGMVASAVTGLMSAQERAVFQASDFVVLTLTAGPKIVAPAAVQARSWPSGHWPASRVPSYSSSPCMPSTSSAAWPISTPMSG